MDLSLRKFRKNIAAFSVLALIASFLVVGTANAALATDVYEDVDGTEWYAADVQWGLDSGILDDTQAYFRAGDNATRAEFFKMTAAGAGIPEAACDETLFPDLNADHWACGWITAMAESGIVNGDGASSPTPGHVRPNDNILRAEAAKVVVEAYGLTGTTPGTVFSDVDGSEWYSDYAGIANENCVFRGVGSTMNLEPGRNIVRAEAIAVVNRGAHPTTECAVVVPASGALTVALDGSSPAGVDIPNNGANIPYTVFALTAEAGGEDVRLEELTLTREGLGLPSDFDSVKLYVNGVQYGSQKTVNTSTNTATFSLAGDPILVPAGSTVLLTVRADMAGADNSQNAFCISTQDDVLVYGESSSAEVAAGGSFAVCGNYMTTTSASVGTLTYEYDDYTGDINIGEVNVSAAKLRLEADNTEDMDVELITFKQRGSADPVDFSNPALFLSGVQIADSSVATWEGDFLTFDLSADPIFIERGNSKNVELRVDVVGGLGSTMLFEIYRDWHIEATGRVYHYGVNVEESLTPPVIAPARLIIGGNLGFALSSENPTVGDMLGDAEDQKFLHFNVSTAGEGVTLNSYDIILTYVNGTARAYEELQDVKLWTLNSADDWVSVGTLDPVADTCLDGVTPIPTLGCAAPGADVALTLAFSDTWDLAPNTTTPFMITADGNNAPDDAEYYVAFDAGTVDAEYAEGDPVLAADISGGVLQGNAQTVSLPTLDVIVSSAPPAYVGAGDEQLIVGGTLDVEPANWDLTASSAADILVTSITVTCTYQDIVDSFGALAPDGDDCADVFSNIELAAKDGSTYTALDTGSFSSGVSVGPDLYESTVVFNGLNFTVPAGQVEKLALLVNTSKAGDADPANVNPADFANFGILVAADVSAEYTEDTILPTVQAAPNETRVEFLPAGTLTVAVDGTTPPADVVVDGTSGIHVSKIKLSANENEDILVQKLRLRNNADTSCAIANDAVVSSVSLEKDGTVVATGVLSSGVVVFDMTSSPVFVPKDTNVSLDVFIDTNDITSSGPYSGDCVTLAPDLLDGNYEDFDLPVPLMDVKAVGASSGTGLDGDGAGAGTVVGGTGYGGVDVYVAGFKQYTLRNNIPRVSLNGDSPSGLATINTQQEVYRFDINVEGTDTMTLSGLNFGEYGSCSVNGHVAAAYNLYYVAPDASTTQLTATAAAASFLAGDFINTVGIEVEGGTIATFYLEADTASLAGGCALDETLSYSLENINWDDSKATVLPLTEVELDEFPVAGDGMQY